MGIGVAVVMPLRKVLDDSFGDGVFSEVLELTYPVQVNVKMLHDGSAYVADLVEVSGELMAKSISTTDDLRDERFETKDRLGELEDKYHDNTFVKLTI